MSTDEEAKSKLVGAIAAAAVTIQGASVDPALLQWLGGVVLNALLDDPWAEARRAGLERAAKVVDAASAEAATRARNP